MLADLSKEHDTSRQEAESVARKVLSALHEPYDLGNEDYSTTASIGITLFVNHDASPLELLKQADLAMYEAKAAGRNTVAVYSPDRITTIDRLSTASAREETRETQQQKDHEPEEKSSPD